MPLIKPYSLLFIKNNFIVWSLVMDSITLHISLLLLLLLLLLQLLLHPFNGIFSRTNWLCRYQKGKPFWTLMEQKMMGWQWHQLDHMQIICILLQTDNHVSTSPISFLQAGCHSCHPTNSIKALKANLHTYRPNAS